MGPRRWWWFHQQQVIEIAEAGARTRNNVVARRLIWCAYGSKNDKARYRLLDALVTLGFVAATPLLVPRVGRVGEPEPTIRVRPGNHGVREELEPRLPRPPEKAEEVLG